MSKPYSCPACGAEYNSKRGRFTHTTVHCDKATDEHIDQVSQWTQGENNPFYGKKHDQETRAKMSQSRQELDLTGENNPNYRHGVFTGKVCEQCGSEFKPSSKSQKYCSEECTAKAQTKSKQQQICPQCGDLFTPKKDGRKYCSRECADDQRATHNSESFYRAVTNQLSDHCWTTERNNSIESKCENCGTENDLQLHHIVPVMAGGLNETWNYLTLCASCHTNAEHYTRDIFTRFSEL